MVELGELEKRHEDFAKRNVRVAVVSNDDQASASITQASHPHLLVVADTDQKLATALQVIHPGMGPGGTDTNAPTTFLVDGTGTVRWWFRPDRVIVRLSPDELLAAIDDTQRRK
jgi:alkyl hydroperoxide reductase subunit AhpC